MQRFWIAINMLALLAASSLMTGCPNGPELVVEPAAISFGASSTIETFRVRNAGSGALEWAAASGQTWLTVQNPPTGKQNGASGTVTNETDYVQVLLDRSALPIGISTGSIEITSNGGDKSIPVSAQLAPQAMVSVSTDSVDFGTTQTQSVVTLTNLGVTKVDWSAQVQVTADKPWLSIAPLTGSLAAQNETDSITLTVSREGLLANIFTGQVLITTSAGNVTINVRMEVPPMVVTPLSIDFGRVTAIQTQNINLSSRSSRALNVHFASNANWLSVTPNPATVGSLSLTQVSAVANATGLAPASYTGALTVTVEDDSFSQVIPVRMLVPGLDLSTATVDFGVLTEQDSKTLNLINLGGTPISWTLEIPDSALQWLTIAPDSGTLDTQSPLTITANPANVDPGQYEAEVTVASDSGDATFTVTMARPRPPLLVAQPTNLDFGASNNEDIVALWNDGLGTINWSIDTTAFPAWLTLTPVNEDGIASGTVSGETTNLVTLRVDRSQGPADVNSFSHTFTATAAGDASNTIDITINVSVPKIPEMNIVADGEDVNDIPFVNIDIEETERQFIIQNVNNGVLNWTISQEDLPAWIVSINPAQGSLQPYKQQIVTLTVDRTTLTYLGDQFPLAITSNDPLKPEATVRVEIQVPKVITIQASKSTLTFNASDVSKDLAVANYGDPDTVLNYVVLPSKEWLSVFPETGTSIGTALPLKDWVDHSVSIDRSKLEGGGAAARLEIFAYKTNEQNQLVRDDSIEPASVDISVEAAELSFELAKPALRMPSLVRYAVTMRNVQYNTISLPDSQLDTIGQQYAIFENNQLLEGTETNQFLTSGKFLRGRILLLLDYSGSMYQAAQEVEDPDVANATDPLQAMYEKILTPLILGIPENYEIGIAIFNEATFGTNSVRAIYENPTDTLFSRDRQELLDRLDSIDVEAHGGTMLLNGVYTGVALLQAAHGNYVPFDTVDDSLILCVTDGRITTTSTPPGSVNPLLTLLADYRVRASFIGWGGQVATEPLIRMANRSGGHLYSTRNEPTGETDSFGRPETRPLVSELLNWCVQDDAETDPCDLSIAKDLSSQTILSYVSLEWSSGVSVEGRLTFNDPTDQSSSCISEQGVITGSFSHKQMDFSSIAGDAYLGQLSLWPTEVSDNGVADIRIHADYIPRNIDQITIHLFMDQGNASIQVVKTNQEDGGIAYDWDLIPGPGGTFTFTSPSHTPLPFGSSGDLGVIHLTNVVGDARLRFEVTDPIIHQNDPNSRYFICPDSVTLSRGYEIVPAFPYPAIETVPAGTPDVLVPNLIDINIGTLDNASLVIRNDGGSFGPFDFNNDGLTDDPGYFLYWTAEVTSDPDENAGSVTLSALGGSMYSTLDSYNLLVTPYKSLPPGVYDSEVTVTYTSALYPLSTLTNWFHFVYTVLPPQMQLSTGVLNFGDTATTVPFTISNVGNSILNWYVAVDSLPEWLSLTTYTSQILSGESISVDALINRGLLPAGVNPVTAQITILNTSGGIVLGVINVQALNP